MQSSDSCAQSQGLELASSAEQGRHHTTLSGKATGEERGEAWRWWRWWRCGGGAGGLVKSSRDEKQCEAVRLVGKKEKKNTVIKKK